MQTTEIQDLHSIAKDKFKAINIRKRFAGVTDFVQSLIIAIVLSLMAFAFITPSEVEGSSMEPNFHNGERVYTDRLPQWLNDTALGQVLNADYNRGDVIVFYKPGMSASLIKRVIGMPGDKVMIKQGHFYINEKLLVEDYLDSSVYTNGGTFLPEGSEVTVPGDSYFVAGDNRSVSNDSRYLGFIKKEWMQGKVVFRLWPLDKLGVINEGKFEIQ